RAGDRVGPGPLADPHLDVDDRLGAVAGRGDPRVLVPLLDRPLDLHRRPPCLVDDQCLGPAPLHPPRCHAPHRSPTTPPRTPVASPGPPRPPVDHPTTRARRKGHTRTF